MEMFAKLLYIVLWYWLLDEPGNWKWWCNIGAKV